jgi:hypothetical protein
MPLATLQALLYMKRYQLFMTPPAFPLDLKLCAAKQGEPSRRANTKSAVQALLHDAAR